MKKLRTILHCDLNNFFASCECKLNPELKNIPMAVAGDMEARKGIILAKNELAKSYGIVTAETIWSARRKCPELTLVPPHMDLYKSYSQKVRNILCEYTDMVEPFGIDECYLDVTASEHLFGNGETIAKILKKRIKDETGLTVSVGVSFNKAFAKLGSDYKKPDAVTVISYENYKNFVKNIPVENLLLIGGEVKKRLNRMGIYTIGELADENKNLLIDALGKIGGIVHDYANGLDESDVEKFDKRHSPKSIGNGNTFSENIADETVLFSEFMKLCEEIALRLRKEELKGTVVCLNLKAPDFKAKSRQKTLLQPTNLASKIFDTVTEIYKEGFKDFKNIRSATVTLRNLVSNDYVSEQISMFSDIEEKMHSSSKIEETMYKIKNKYGFNSISYGISMNNDIKNNRQN